MLHQQFYAGDRLAGGLRVSAKEHQQLLEESESYLRLFHYENEIPDAFWTKFALVRAEIEKTGTYWHTYEELAYGARVAWRNNSRCIGRLHWKSLAVRDMRHLTKAEDIFEALVEHLRFATNGGKIRSTITVFAPKLPGQQGIRIWNPQLIRYAGYRQPGGLIIGDPLHEDITAAKHGVTIVDHHTASRQFLLHEQQEKQAGRVIPAHWVWLVPPISGSASPLFHNPYY